MNGIFNLIFKGINSCLIWFSSFDSAFSGSLSSSIMTVFIMYTTTRLLLLPFIGQASSDLVSDYSKDATFRFRTAVGKYKKKVVEGFRDRFSKSKK